MNLAEVCLLTNDLDVLSGTVLSDFSVNSQYTGCTNHSNSYIFPINIKAGTRLEPRLLEIGRWGRHIIFKFTTCTFVIKIAHKASVKVVKRLYYDPREKPSINNSCVEMVFRSITTDYSMYLFFQDPLQCSFVAVYPAMEVPVEFSYLGMDILDSLFNFDYIFSEVIKLGSNDNKITVKSFIMDTNVIAWLDNEFASEALFISGINPHTKVSDLTREELNILVISLRSVYDTAIDHLRNGMYSTSAIPLENLYTIYGRDGDVCVGCSANIKKSVINGLRTYWCPNCQKEKVRTNG